MKHRLSKWAIFVEALTGTALIIYTIYACGMTAAQLAVIPFMLCCVIIVIAGFAVAALCECLVNKTQIESVSKVIIRQAIKAAVLVAVIAAICFVIHAKIQGEESSDPPVPVLYIYDVRDMAARIGDSDYVFVANVVKKGDVVEFPDGGMPETNYQLQVLKNIKGDLVMDKIIPLKKEGGYSKSEHFNYVIENDFLPEEGDLCLFLTCASEEGDLYASGENSTILLKSAAENPAAGKTLNEEQQSQQLEDIEKIAEYQEVVNALATQFDPTGRERFESQYEKKTDE